MISPVALSRSRMLSAGPEAAGRAWLLYLVLGCPWNPVSCALSTAVLPPPHGSSTMIWSEANRNISEVSDAFWGAYMVQRCRHAECLLQSDGAQTELCAVNNLAISVKQMRKKSAHAKEMRDPKSSSYGSGNLNEDLVILLLLRNCKTCGVISYTIAKIWIHLSAMACDCYEGERGDGTSETLP